VVRRLLYRNFTAFYWLDRWFRDRLTPAGRLLVGGLVAGGVFGVDVTMSHAFRVFALGLGLLAVAALGVVLTRPRLGVRRTLPRFATVGEPVRYRLVLTNLAKRACPPWLAWPWMLYCLGTPARMSACEISST
jgi:hypothetical protein